MWAREGPFESPLLRMNFWEYFQWWGSRLGIGHTVAAQGSVTRNVLLLNYSFASPKGIFLPNFTCVIAFLFAPFRTFLRVGRLGSAVIQFVLWGVAWQSVSSWSPLPQRAHTAGRWQELRPCPYLWHLKQRRGLGTNSSTGILIYAALANGGGVGAEKVKMNVFDGSFLSPLRRILCLTAATPCEARPLNTSASSQSRRSRQRITPRHVFKLRWGVTVISVSNQMVMANAFVACCLVFTASSMVPLRSFLAPLTSPTPHWMNFWTANIEYLIGVASFDEITRKRGKEGSDSSSETWSLLLLFFLTFFTR